MHPSSSANATKKSFLIQSNGPKAQRQGLLASTFSSRNKNIKNRESFQAGEQD